MPKLMLDLDQIRVESFSTGSVQPAPERIPTTNTQDPDCTYPTRCNPLQC
ncbi:MAG TPA: hypothetical protein VF746_21065 [Longimicrobium sp.]|jgi:hypothetical protein